MEEYGDGLMMCQIDQEKLIKEVYEIVSYVSASDNGNTIPKRAKKHPELLWVRFADRLEAIGPIGAVRCYQYNTEKGESLSVSTTPRPKTKQEVWANVTPDRLQKYMETKDSASMMDHYFDKLLQIARFEQEIVKNNFLCQEAEKRVEPLVDICLEWGRTGKVPVDLIMSHADKSSKKKKTEEKKVQKNEPAKIPALKKQIKRKQLAQGLTISQRRLKIK